MSTPYEDELTYSWIARYIHTSGRTSYVHSSRDLFSIKVACAHVYYPTHLDYFCQQLPEHFSLTPLSIINKNTIIPLFTPFMDSERASSVIKAIRDGESKRLVGQIGINTGNIFKKDERVIKVCPECLKQFKANNQEAFILRQHVVPGNLICKRHNVFLVDYEIPSSLSRYFYYDVNEIDVSKLHTVHMENRLKDYFLNLYDDIDYVLQGGLKDFDIKHVKERYRQMLRQKGYLLDDRIRQNELVVSFLEYYPIDFLLKLESLPNLNDRGNWVREIAVKRNVQMHAIRHLLFIRFLFGGIQEFVNYRDTYKPFGVGPWPCLNKVCDNYMKPTVSTYELKRLHSLTKPIGVFKCECGFMYNRQGPDEFEDDKYKYGKVLDFGHVWKDKLRGLILTKDMSIAKIADEMCCYRNTVIKYAEELGVVDNLNTKQRFSPKAYDKRLSDQEYEGYKTKIINYIRENPESNREDIKVNLTKEFGLVFIRDKKWLNLVLPKAKKGQFTVDYKDKDWNSKDVEVNLKMVQSIQDILKAVKPQRITKTDIANRINYFGILDRGIIERLPKSKETLINNCETVEQFRKRKLKINIYDEIRDRLT